MAALLAERGLSSPVGSFSFSFAAPAAAAALDLAGAEPLHPVSLFSARVCDGVGGEASLGIEVMGLAGGGVEVAAGRCCSLRWHAAVSVCHTFSGEKSLRDFLRVGTAFARALGKIGRDNTPYCCTRFGRRL